MSDCELGVSGSNQRSQNISSFKLKIRKTVFCDYSGLTRARNHCQSERRVCFRGDAPLAGRNSGANLLIKSATSGQSTNLFSE
jgi:hypothetical protein